MATRTKKLSQAERREFQKNLSTLKAKGLISDKIDIRKQPATRHMREQIKRFRGVISGNEQVVKVPRKEAAKFDGVFDRKGDRVTVPKPQLGGRARYSKKAGTIVSKAKVPGGTVTTYSRRYSMEELKKLEGTGVSFSIYLNRIGRNNEAIRRSTVAELEQVLEDGSIRNFTNWSKFVFVEILDGEIDEDAEFEF